MTPVVTGAEMIVPDRDLTIAMLVDEAVAAGARTDPEEFRARLAAPGGVERYILWRREAIARHGRVCPKPQPRKVRVPRRLVRVSAQRRRRGRRAVRSRSRPQRASDPHESVARAKAAARGRSIRGGS